MRVSVTSLSGMRRIEYVANEEREDSTYYGSSRGNMEDTDGFRTTCDGRDRREYATSRSPDLEDSLLQDFATRPIELTGAFHSVLDKQDPIYLKLLHGFLKHLPSRTVFTQIVTHLRPKFEVLANLALVWDDTSAPTTKQRTYKPALGFWDN